MGNISPLTSAISFFHPKKSYTQAALGSSPSREREGAWGSGQGPSCSVVPLRVQSPPAPGVGCDLLKDRRLWLQENLSSSMLNKASQKGVGAIWVTICLLLLGAPSSFPCSPLPATLHPIPSHSHHPVYHPRSGASICKNPVIYTIIIWLHKPIPPSRLSAVFLSAAWSPSNGTVLPGGNGRWMGGGCSAGEVHCRATSSSHGNCGPGSRGAGTRIPPTP